MFTRLTDTSVFSGATTFT